MRKSNYFLIFLGCLFCCSFVFAQEKINISTQTSVASSLTVQLVYPRENAKIPFVERSFVFGSVFPPQSKLWINGIGVPLYRTGSFLAMIPFQSGENKIQVQAQIENQTVQVNRTVFVSSRSVPLPFNFLTMDSLSFQPSTKTIVALGDTVGVQFRGTPSCKAEFRIRDWRGSRHQDWIEMKEKGLNTGVYESYIFVDCLPNDLTTTIEYRLSLPSGKNIKVSKNNPIEVLSNNSFQLLEIISEEAVVRAGPNIESEQMGYDLFLPKGTRLSWNSKVNNDVRVQLSKTVAGWIDQKNIQFLPKNEVLSKQIIQSVVTLQKEKSVIFSLEVQEKIPYRISIAEDLRGLQIELYQAISNIDRVRYDGSELRKFKQIRWSQSAEDTVLFYIDLKEKIKGYDVRYENKKLVFEVFFYPPKSLLEESLKGWTVSVDPGHSKEMGDGTMGPQGVKESEICYQMALLLQKKLEKAGAKVVLTRSSEEVISLPERGKRAYQSNADLFISIHANALPDGANALERRGFSIYYFQHFGLSFAQAVHSAYLKRTHLIDDGFYYGNLAVCRITQMPSILLETGYLIHPAEEELLLSSEFQLEATQGMFEGIVSFVKER